MQCSFVHISLCEALGRLLDSVCLRPLIPYHHHVHCLQNVLISQHP